MRHLLGVDQPLAQRYGQWLAALAHGNLGSDLFSGEPVSGIIAARLLPTLSLILGTVVVAGLVGTWLAAARAARACSAGSSTSRPSSYSAVPSFCSRSCSSSCSPSPWDLPPGGYVDPRVDPAGWLAAMALPIATLAAGGIAFVAKQTRDSMSEVLRQEYITMLRARGLAERSIVYKHALRNAAIPVVTMLGLLLVNLLSGAVVIEGIFSVPGLGQQAVIASGDHNLPLITGIAFCFTIVVITTNLLVDLAYRALNPKVRQA
jgi:peptide/nickel transport system permease protein